MTFSYFIFYNFCLKLIKSLPKILYLDTKPIIPAYSKHINPKYFFFIIYSPPIHLL